MTTLRDHFDRIAIISLPERRERRERLLKNLTSTGLATPEDLTWVEAVDGRKENLPAWWQEGAGAWGCRHSQLKVLRDAQKDGLNSVLILEDDAVFHSRSSEWLTDVMAALPEDWDQFFLGGQFTEPPKASAHPLILIGNGITRTHAYAVHRKIFQRLINIVSDDQEYQQNPTWHVDHQYRHHQNKWNTYAPAWWLAGQEEGETDIAKGKLPRRWWQQGLDFWKLPFIQVPDDSPSQNKLLVFATPPESNDSFDLAHWFRRAAYEAWEQGRLPACRESLFTSQTITRHWPAGFQSFQGHEPAISALADYPANGLFDHPFSQKQQN